MKRLNFTKHVFAFLLCGLALLCLSITDLSAQPWMQSLSNNPNPNFFEIQDAFKTYWTGKTVEKGKGFKAFKRWEWYWERRINADGTFPDAALAMKGLKEATEMGGTANKGNMMPTWSTMGPNSTSGGYAGLGRVNAIAFHPTSSNTFWVGTPGGGLWKTVDGGVNWTTNTDNLALLGVSGIAIAPSNPNIMYIATGDGDGADTYSVGVLKSIDGGTTWSKLTNWWQTVHTDMHDYVFQPGTNNLFQANDGGVWHTSDSGIHWTQKSHGLSATENYHAAASPLYDQLLSSGTQDNGELVRLEGL
ncbi:MAG: WD40/YVTN/BNR-like repeat-containing protein, partial [Saprospiraceae bacterium]